MKAWCEVNKAGWVGGSWGQDDPHMTPQRLASATNSHPQRCAHLGVLQGKGSQLGLQRCQAPCRALAD